MTKQRAGSRAAWVGRVAWGLAVLGAVGCAQVLGIEDAELDPLDGDVCSLYCETALANCVDEHAVYSNDRTCEGVCAELPEGADDGPGNTARCRLRQASLAGQTGEVGFHCPLAGPGGDGACGSNCEGYCTVFAAVCPEDLSGTFGDIDGCLADCPDIPDLGTFDLTQSDGDSIQCRLWHLSAATVDPASHCHHAAGDSPCN